MSKALGQRMLSKQETTHLTISLPIVSCSHVFARMNLDENQHLIKMQNASNENSNMVDGNTNHGSNTVGDIAVTNNENSNVMDGNTTHGNNMPRKNAPQNIVAITTATGTTATKKIIVEMRGLRMDKNHWLNDDSCNHSESGLQLTTLRDFCQKHVVEASKNKRNKLCSQQKNNFVPMFCPKISPNKAGDDYHKCCKHA